MSGRFAAFPKDIAATSEREANLAPRQARKAGAGGTRQSRFSSCPRPHDAVG